jgi:hypothetical protein
MSHVLQARRSQPFPHFTIVLPKHNDAGILVVSQGPLGIIRPSSAPIDKTHPPGYRAGYRENNEYSPKGTKKWAACIVDIDGAVRPFIRGNQKFYSIPHTPTPALR